MHLPITGVILSSASEPPLDIYPATGFVFELSLSPTAYDATDEEFVLD